MRPAAHERDYLDDTGPAYLVIPSGAVFRADARLRGFVLWGRPSSRDLDQMIGLVLADVVACDAHAAVGDLRRVEATDADAFQRFTRHVTTNAPMLRRKVRRIAVLRPPGLVGAIITGFLQIHPPPYPAVVFDDVAAACAWLGSGASDAMAALDDVVESVVGVAPLLVRLRIWLESNLAHARLEAAARALAMSGRALQRSLAELGTSFHRELEATRLRVAKQWLSQTDAAVSEIAYEIGFGSPQHLAALFRRTVGQTPTGFRRAARADQGPESSASTPAGSRASRLRSGNRPTAARRSSTPVA